MKKIVLGLISILLVSAIALTALATAFASTNGIEPKGIDLASLKETDRNSYYAFVAASLLQTFPMVSIEDETGKREVISYPQEYAGAYIDESNTLHIVLTKGASMTTKNNYQAIMGNDKDIVYEYADFSLSRIYEVQRALTSVLQKFNITSTAVNEITNKLDIQLLDISKEKEITDFINAKVNDFDARCITFEERSVGWQLTATDTTSNALAGSNCASSTQLGTLGFNAYRHATGQAGVVTAAHIATAGTTISNAMGTTIGSASVRKYSGNMDAAFIPFPTGITWSWKMSHGYASPDDCITHYYNATYYTAGETVDKIGRSTGVTSGTILSVSFEVPVEGGLTFTDQVQISNQQTGGDSGGPVYHTVVVGGGADLHILVGIATFGDPNSPYYGAVSKVANIMSEFGITPFYGDV